MTYNTMTLHSVAVADANGPSLDCEGYSILGVQITGTFTGTIYFEGTVDESTWVSLEAINVASGAKATSATAAGVYRMGVAGLVQARARLDWGSGEVTATGRLSDAADPVLQDVVLSAGAAAIGVLGANDGVDIGNVDVASITAGETHIGEVGGRCTTISVTPTLTVAGAYTAGEFVGTSATALVFANAVRVSAGSGIIESAVLVDYALQSVACELWLFDTAVTPPADNAAWTITDAHSATCIGVIPFSTYYASALNSVSSEKGLGIAFKAIATTIWGALVTRGTPTYASGDVTVRLSIMQD